MGTDSGDTECQGTGREQGESMRRVEDQLEHLVAHSDEGSAGAPPGWRTGILGVRQDAIDGVTTVLIDSHATDPQRLEEQLCRGLSPAGRQLIRVCPVNVRASALENAWRLLVAGGWQLPGDPRSYALDFDVETTQIVVTIDGPSLDERVMSALKQISTDLVHVVVVGELRRQNRGRSLAPVRRPSSQCGSF